VNVTDEMRGKVDPLGKVFTTFTDEGISDTGALILPIDEGFEPLTIATQYKNPAEMSPTTTLFLIRVTVMVKEVRV
jgi:hypothetical protein